MRFRIAALALTALVFTRPALTRQLAIAAAADLQFALTDLGNQYEKQTGATLSITYGSSGNFFAQLQNGAPFDLFFSADVEYPRRLEAAGLTEPGTLTVYARGQIVLWAPPGSNFDFARQGLSSLMDPRIQKIAIANPDHAPYGRAAVAALKKDGIYERIKSKLVLGENISQAAQFVQSGNAQVGVIALSLAASPAMKDGQRWEVPLELYPSLVQAAVVMKASQHKQLARDFLGFLQTDAARATLARYGFALPATGSGERKP